MPSSEDERPGLGTDAKQKDRSKPKERQKRTTTNEKGPPNKKAKKKDADKEFDDYLVQVAERKKDKKTDAQNESTNNNRMKLKTTVTVNALRRSKQKSFVKDDEEPQKMIKVKSSSLDDLAAKISQKYQNNIKASDLYVFNPKTKRYVQMENAKGIKQGCRVGFSPQLPVSKSSEVHGTSSTNAHQKSSKGADSNDDSSDSEVSANDVPACHASAHFSNDENEVPWCNTSQAAMAALTVLAVTSTEKITMALSKVENLHTVLKDNTFLRSLLEALNSVSEKKTDELVNLIVNSTTIPITLDSSPQDIIEAILDEIAFTRPVHDTLQKDFKGRLVFKDDLHGINMADKYVIPLDTNKKKELDVETALHVWLLKSGTGSNFMYYEEMPQFMMLNVQSGGKEGKIKPALTIDIQPLQDPFKFGLTQDTEESNKDIFAFIEKTPNGHFQTWVRDGSDKWLIYTTSGQKKADIDSIDNILSERTLVLIIYGNKPDDEKDYETARDSINAMLRDLREEDQDMLRSKDDGFVCEPNCNKVGCAINHNISLDSNEKKALSDDDTIIIEPDEESTPKDTSRNQTVLKKRWWQMSALQRTRLENTERQMLTKDESSLYDDIIKSVLVNPTKMNISWDDIIGHDCAKEELQNVFVKPNLAVNLYRGLPKPKGFLFCGPPGTGKTMLACALANEASMTFLRLNTSSIVSKWVGESSKLVHILYTIARSRAPSIIFIDEIDAISTNRASAETDHNRELKTQLMIEMDGFDTKGESRDVFTIGATNLPEKIDPAIRRRLGRKIVMGLPSSSGRILLCKKYLKEENVIITAKEWKKVGELTTNYSPSDMENVVLHVRRQLRADLLSNLSPQEICELDESEDLQASLKPITFKDMESGIQKTPPSTSDKELGQYTSN